MSRFAVVVFPGSNCDHDAYHAVKHVLGHNAAFVWHKDASLCGADAVILPGGFSYGDYLRSGAIARFSPIMGEVARFAAAGGPVLGVCNGFQVLLEAGLLPGGMRRNRHLEFICQHVHVRVEQTDTPFTCNARAGQVLRLPIAHGEGNYYADAETLAALEAKRQIVFRYTGPDGELDEAWNVNGSTAAIAGLCSAGRNVVGLMPHPERACESALGSADGLVVLESAVAALAAGADSARRAQRASAGAARGAGAPASERRGFGAQPRLIEAAHGLTGDEYRRVVDILGREPNLTELGIFSVMWSEHCSYKSSRRHLRKLPTAGARVLQGPGENAGAIDIGDGLAAVFKIESHNHPSFIEPYQGAATGVGGIIRDIFTMGARPIALLDSLRFGPPGDPGTRRLVEGVVAGIAGYGNSIGIPTVGGELAFDESYAGNPLVNVFCLGTARTDALVRGRAEGVGNAVYYVGARTGRDGIHGATMASAEFDEMSAEKRPNVQVGDPFMEKLLLEACLEVMRTDALIGIQDMGAAGLTCSTCEMGSRGGAGIEIDVRRVPQRETGMTPYEIMLSESQERMLFVVRRGREAEVERVFEKWDLHAVRIGQVTADGLLRVRDGGAVVAEIPNRALADDAPVYDRPVRPPADLAERRALDLGLLAAAPAPADAFLALLASPQVASRRWVYRQYDHMVRTNTIAPAGMGAGVVRVKGTRRALAFSVDGNGRYCYLDPRQGARLAVAESARNVACTGAVPVGATNCLNFGSPERPDIMWQFAEAVEGIAETCRALDIPITGGNVSLYNETDGEAVHPTPVLGVVGVIEDAARTLGRVFRKAGSVVVLLGPAGAELGGSEYLKVVHGLVRGRPPALDADLERALQRLLADAAADGWLESAHDCAEGGVAVALAECCFDGGGGVDVALPAQALDGPAGVALAGTLFGETASRVIVSLAESRAGDLLTRAAAAGVPARAIGRTGGTRCRIAVDGAPVIDVPVAQAEQAWATGLSRYFGPEAARKCQESAP